MGTIYVDDISAAIVAAPPLAGDYNGNGIVDAADYTIYAQHGRPIRMTFRPTATAMARSISQYGHSGRRTSAKPPAAVAAVATHAQIYEPVDGNTIFSQVTHIVATRNVALFLNLPLEISYQYH